MADLTAALTRYLTQVFGKPATVLRLTPIGEVPSGDSIKTYGYGKPIRVDYQLEGGVPQSAVLHTSSPSPFGHEHMADRAQGLLWAHQAFNRLPRHVRSLDVGAFRADGALVSLGNAEELFLLSEYAEGRGYQDDLQQILKTGQLTELDIRRCDALCDYLIAIHQISGPEPGLYTRRIRELVGHGECVMGLTDSYPAHPLIAPSLLECVEHLCVKWRWKLKDKTHRLRQVHGDFHPWNILFEQGSTNLRVLDRSRGEWGEAADDVASITANYLFFSLQRSGCLEGAFETLLERFWERYLAATHDDEMLRVVAPFYAFRGLVMASPVWYPSLSDAVRRKLLSFIVAVLKADTFSPEEVNAYCGD